MREESGTHEIDQYEKARYVRLRKDGPTENAEYPTPDWDHYPFGTAPAGISLPTGYQLIGLLVRPPEVGSQLMILRLSRNNVAISGLFYSTTVIDINGSCIQTMNSIYRLEYLVE